MFSRHGDGGDRSAELEELAALERQLDTERRTERGSITAAETDDHVRAAAENPVAAQLARAAEAETDRGSRSPLTRRRIATAAAVIGAVMLGLVVGEATEFGGHPDVPALAIFDEPRQVDDRLVNAGVGESIPALPSTTLQLNSARYLAQVGPRRILAVRGESTDICLVAVTIDGKQIGAACVDEADFPDAGVGISFIGRLPGATGSTTASSAATAPAGVIQAFYSVRWMPDGSIDSSFEALTLSSVG